jgi:hypothetical protein
MTLYIYRVERSYPVRKSFYMPNLPGLFDLTRTLGHRLDRLAPVRSVWLATPAIAATSQTAYRHRSTSLSNLVSYVPYLSVNIGPLFFGKG